MSLISSPTKTTTTYTPGANKGPNCFAENLTKLAKHINVMNFEEGKAAFEEVATFSLEGKPVFLNKVKFNLSNITTKVNLQKYVYNCILCGSGLNIKN